MNRLHDLNIDTHSKLQTKTESNIKLYSQKYCSFFEKKLFGKNKFQFDNPIFQKISSFLSVWKTREI